MAVHAQAQSFPARSNWLRRAIQADGACSVVSGLACLADAGWLAALLGVPVMAMYALGAVLLGYAVFLFAVAAREPINRRAVIAALALDVAWVLDSIVLLASGWLALTTAGWWIVAVTALLVVDFAVLKYVGLRRVLRSSQ
jgi:hypothetical protein